MRIWKHLLPLLACTYPLMLLAGPVNVNTADADTIAAALNGIGPAKAQAIIEYREKHGPFKTPEDLSLVKGIGDRTVEINLTDILVGPVARK